MRARRMAALALVGFALPLAGCASSRVSSTSSGADAPVPTVETPAAEPPGAAGVAALRENEFEAARTAFESTIERCGTSPAGESAAILLAAAAVDPRYDEPDLAAALTATLLNQPYRSDWATGMAQSIYLVARSVGGDAKAESVIMPSGPADGFPADCTDWELPEPTAGDSTALPAFDSPSWPARLWRRTAKVQSLEGQVDSLTAELDRIRETLRP